MKVNWKRFVGLFVLFNAVLALSGCGNWIGAIQALMPAISAAISAIFAFIGALEGKTVPTSVTDFVKKLEADVSLELQNVSNILSTIATNAGQTVLQQIEEAFQAIVSNLNSILAGLNVTDSSTIAKITNFVALAVSAVEAVLALIPLAMKASSLSDAEKLQADKAATVSLKSVHKVLQQDYHTTVTTLTGQAEVDLALAGLPQQLP
jgi:hypothetical protein